MIHVRSGSFMGPNVCCTKCVCRGSRNSPAIDDICALARCNASGCDRYPRSWHAVQTGHCGQILSRGLPPLASNARNRSASSHTLPCWNGFAMRTSTGISFTCPHRYIIDRQRAKEGSFFDRYRSSAASAKLRLGIFRQVARLFKSDVSVSVFVNMSASEAVIARIRVPRSKVRCNCAERSLSVLYTFNVVCCF